MGQGSKELSSDKMEKKRKVVERMALPSRKQRQNKKKTEWRAIELGNLVKVLRGLSACKGWFENSKIRI